MKNHKRSSKRRTVRQRRRNSGIPRGYARPATAHQRAQEHGSNCFDAPEVWHEPTGEDGFRVVRQKAGNGYFHPLTAAEVRDRVDQLPQRYTRGLDVVQFSRMTRKRAIFPVYGMQWGSAVYLYPIEDALTEYFSRPPQPQQVIDTKMYGGQWSEENGGWVLTWTRETIRDFYLNNILIHEIGHINDDRNTSYVDRERYANWFAIEYGYRAKSS